MLDLDTVTEDELRIALSTRENVISELESVRSPYNTSDFEDLELTIYKMLAAGKERFATQLRIYGRHVSRVKITIIREYEKVTLIQKGEDYGEYFLYHPLVDGLVPRWITRGYNLADMEDLAQSY